MYLYTLLEFLLIGIFAIGRKKIFFPPLSYIWQTTVPEAIKEFVTKGKNKQRNNLIKYRGNEIPFGVSLWLVVACLQESEK